VFILAGLIGAYFVGHLLGFLSSITVEKIALVYFGFPSQYLTGTFEHQGRIFSRTAFENIGERRTFSVIMVQAIMVPLVVTVWMLVCFSFTTVLLKRMPQSMIDMLEQRFEVLSGRKIDFDKSREWFRFIAAYVVNNNPVAFLRMYNYLTMYGMLRNMTFVFVLGFWVYLVLYLSSIDVIWCPQGLQLLSRPWQLGASVLNAVFGAATFCAYIKFYRRYSEEGIHAFVAMPISPSDHAIEQCRARECD
jgi:hypothetical protein